MSLIRLVVVGGCGNRSVPMPIDKSVAA